MVVFFGESGCRGFGAGIDGAFSSTSLMTAFSDGRRDAHAVEMVVGDGRPVRRRHRRHGDAQGRALLLKFQESVFRALEASLRELFPLARRRARVVGAGLRGGGMF